MISITFLRSCQVYFDELNMKWDRTKYDHTVLLMQTQ